MPLAPALSRAGVGSSSGPHQVAVAGLHIGRGGKAGQALLIHEQPQWVTGRHQDIDPHIELEAVDEEGLRGGSFVQTSLEALLPTVTTVTVSGL